MAMKMAAKKAENRNQAYQWQPKYQSNNGETAK
jgi:hypothetical protein